MQSQLSLLCCAYCSNPSRAQCDVISCSHLVGADRTAITGSVQKIIPNQGTIGSQLCSVSLLCNIFEIRCTADIVGSEIPNVL